METVPHGRDAVAAFAAAEHEARIAQQRASASRAPLLRARNECRDILNTMRPLEPGQGACVDPGLCLRCREVQSQRALDHEALAAAAAAVSPRRVEQERARAAASAAPGSSAAPGGSGGSGGSAGPSASADDEAWWTCTLESARQAGAVQTAVVLEFAETLGRAEEQTLRPEQLEAARALWVAEQALRAHDGEAAARRARREAALREALGAEEAARQHLLTTGRPERVTLRTDDGESHVYTLQPVERERKRTPTPAMLSSKGSRAAASAEIAALRRAAASGPGGATLEAAARVIEGATAASAVVTQGVRLRCVRA